ncbi:unnamed protein product [Nesidiocoris tenuis]|uniref:Uncharacterized protein n=1 Tax=Nesidiocoris tenuis TaxID=355587 RepID=A0A6H5GPC4_9HEMI|nr:unnamed protein product [Nesidiocoris tenuis]
MEESERQFSERDEKNHRKRSIVRSGLEALQSAPIPDRRPAKVQQDFIRQRRNVLRHHHRLAQSGIRRLAAGPGFARYSKFTTVDVVAQEETRERTRRQGNSDRAADFDEFGLPVPVQSMGVFQCRRGLPFFHEPHPAYENVQFSAEASNQKQNSANPHRGNGRRFDSESSQFFQRTLKLRDSTVALNYCDT